MNSLYKFNICESTTDHMEDNDGIWSTANRLIFVPHTWEGKYKRNTSTKLLFPLYRTARAVLTPSKRVFRLIFFYFGHIQRLSRAVPASWTPRKSFWREILSSANFSCFRLLVVMPLSSRTRLANRCRPSSFLRSRKTGRKPKARPSHALSSAQTTHEAVKARDISNTLLGCLRSFELDQQFRHGVTYTSHGLTEA